MSFTTYKLRDINEVDVFINGGIIGTDVARGVLGLIGTTLTFTSPAFAVTFTQPVTTTRDPNLMMLADIKTQVELADPNILVKQIGGKIVFIERTPTNGVVLAAGATLAKPLLGFNSNAVVTGRVLRQMYSPAPPRIETVYQTNDGTHVCIVWEGN